MSDTVNHPEHYGGKDNPYEAIKIIEAYDLNFSLGNALKYMIRADKKGNQLEDLKKACWYINREVERLEAKVVVHEEVVDGGGHPREVHDTSAKEGRLPGDAPEKAFSGFTNWGRTPRTTPTDR